MRLIVNGQEHAVELASGSTLLDVLREDLGLTGTKYGCGEGQCGACTVLVDGQPIRACIQDAASVAGPVTTIEGLATDGCLHRVQAAFVAERALQCGFCTPGMVMTAAALLERDPAPDEAAVCAALAGNVCRCGGYPRIMAAVQAAAANADTAKVAVEPQDEVKADAIAWTVIVPGSAVQRGDRGWSTPGGTRLAIDADGQITAYVGKVDAGQGNRVALTRLIAAELAVSTADVRLEMGDTASAPLDLGTVGSRSMPDAGDALCLAAGTAARELLAAAAKRWDVDAAGLAMAAGAVRDATTGREIGYGELVADGARTITVDPDSVGPEATIPRDVDDAQQRQWLAAAVTGSKRFPSDIVLPDMAHGRILRPPAHGSTATTVDTTAAEAMSDITVVSEGGFVGVVAPTPAAANRALQSLRADWAMSAQPDEEELEKYLRDHAIDREGWGGVVHREAGDVDAAFAEADVVLAATYTTAYLAHVPMEPRVAVAEVNADSATVWVGTQRPFGVRDEVASALGLATERVRIVVPDFGGGFGGKHFGDVAVEAARLARGAGRPVKVSWSRAEEFHWAYFRPAAVIDVRLAAGADGTLSAWEFTNLNAGAAGLFTPYQVANRRERFQPAESPLPQGSYRALAATANHFARESHVDELAITIGADPVELRQRLLRDERLRDVVTALAEHVGWSGPGSNLGIACGVEKDARVATLAEVSVEADGRTYVRRIVTAVECGAIVDPTGLRNQVIGATVMGLGGALFERIRFSGGRIHNGSLTDYRVPRLADIPPIDVMLIDRPDLPSAGGGETPIVAVAPAIANAIRAATGRRLHALPLIPDGVLP